MPSAKFSLRRTFAATVVVAGGGALLATAFFLRVGPANPCSLYFGNRVGVVPSEATLRLLRPPQGGSR